MNVSRWPTRGTALLAIAAAIAACSRLAPPSVAATTSPTTPINPVVNCNVTNQDAPVTAKLLSSGVPCEAMVTKPFDKLDHVQAGFDSYSWLTFLGLNAPADGSGPIGSPPTPGGDAPAVWESWKELSDVMLPDGATPLPWDAPRAVPAACRGLGGGKVLRMVGKTPTLLEDTNQPFDTGPLIDQNGNYVRYEILINRPMFEFIVQNRLYSKAGQAAFTGKIAFPQGAVTGKTSGTMGAFTIKAAWKVLGPSDNRAGFHTTEALVYTPAVPQAKVAESCVKGSLGLVGLHVAHKTGGAPQWIWSTFEHRANVPVAGDLAGSHYNFNNPACAGACPVNQPPPRPWNPNVQPFPKGFTSQITRFAAITREVMQLNGQYQGLLTGTVWKNYQLVSTQWPSDPGSATDPNGVPAPTFLANTTMETYIQGRIPQASSSCMACHGNAAATSARTADFTYVLERAK